MTHRAASGTGHLLVGSASWEGKILPNKQKRLGWGTRRGRKKKGWHAAAATPV
jgi:hypothetical protein